MYERDEATVRIFSITLGWTEISTLEKVAAGLPPSMKKDQTFLGQSTNNLPLLDATENRDGVHLNLNCYLRG